MPQDYPTQIYTFIVILFLIFGGVITFDKVMDIVNKWKKPGTTTARKLENDYQRLNEHDDAIKKQQECQQLLCAGVMALLDHELHNGNSDQMQKARDAFDHYLQKNFSK